MEEPTQPTPPVTGEVLGHHQGMFVFNVTGPRSAIKEYMLQNYTPDEEDVEQPLNDHRKLT